jgi:hypothetical protein
MNGSSNHDGRRWRDRDGQWQQQWATVVQLAVGQQSNFDGQWDSGSIMDGTIGGRQSPPMQEQHNGR